MAYCQAMYRARQVEEGHIALERLKLSVLVGA